MSFVVEDGKKSKTNDDDLLLRSRNHIDNRRSISNKELYVGSKKIRAYDRSIIAGHHTSTLQYNSYIPPYRTMINFLYDIHSTKDFQQLLFNFPIPREAPSNVQNLFKYFLMNWNYLIK
ncbi:hypothetical protein [Richelia intracellularis]|uniref:hypothetical protein n=1 Tax=Richelia intracellularis TaxID=1164990 RepID=UPI0005C539D0|nr:hypothetical protein [Richelia intracellularis]